METYISILRGINVSGHKMIKMEALRSLYENLNFKNVKTYIQSGNVVFQAVKTESKDLEKSIATKIAEAFAFEVPVMVKEAVGIAEVLKNNPFVNNRNEGAKLLHVTFLSREPEPADIDKIRNGQYGADEFAIAGKTVYLFCPNGYGNTKLTNSFFENKLKVVATTRNWKTVNELVNIAAEIQGSVNSK